MAVLTTIKVTVIAIGDFIIEKSYNIARIHFNPWTIMELYSNMLMEITIKIAIFYDVSIYEGALFM